VVLPHTPRDRAAEMAYQVRSTLAEIAIPHVTSPVCARVTLSMGVGCKTPAKQNVPDAFALLDEADRNLYLSKRRGRDRVSH
jgi:diguanylate cyclase (GGDEF)-like protein